MSQYIVTASQGIWVREAPSTHARQLGQLTVGTLVDIVDQGAPSDGFLWVRITFPQAPGGTAWAASGDQNSAFIKPFLDMASSGITYDRFDMPIGTDQERQAASLWTPLSGVAANTRGWFDANGFGKGTPGNYLRNYGYHTGSDLNRNFDYAGNDKWDFDRGQPVYAAANGIVRHRYFTRRSWGNVVVIEHPPLPNGETYSTRYAHLADVIVEVNDLAQRGQQIASVGPFYVFSKDANAWVEDNYHLHYDISPTLVTVKTWNHWPGISLDDCLNNYVEPLDFTRQHH